MYNKSVVNVAFFSYLCDNKTILMNHYKVRFKTSFGGSIEVKIYADSDFDARALVKQKFPDLLTEVISTIQIPMVLDNMNDSTENFHIRL